MMYMSMMRTCLSRCGQDRAVVHDGTIRTLAGRQGLSTIVLAVTYNTVLCH